MGSSDAAPPASSCSSPSLRAGRAGRGERRRRHAGDRRPGRARASSSTSRRTRISASCGSPIPTGWSSTCRRSSSREPAKPGEGRGLISDYRYGLIAPGKARIVLDLSGPVEIVNTFVLDPVEPEPARLVIDLVPTTAEAFDEAAARDRPRRDRQRSRAGPSARPAERRRAGRGDRSRPWRHRFRRGRRGRPPGEGRHAGIRPGARAPAAGAAASSSRC